MTITAATSYESYRALRRQAGHDSLGDISLDHFQSLLFHQQKKLIKGLIKEIENLQLEDPHWGQW